MDKMTGKDSTTATAGPSMGHRAFSGVVWSLVDRGATQIIGFVATVVMARLLTPTDYGLIGMLLIFVEVGEALASAGLTQALVAGGMRNSIEQRSAFGLNLAIGGIIYAVLWIGAPWIADFYDEPQLIWLMRAVGWCVPLKACCCLSEARLMHFLAYHRRAVAMLCTLLIAGTVGIWAAATGWGVKAIALYMVLQAALSLIFLSIAASGRDKEPSSQMSEEGHTETTIDKPSLQQKASNAEKSLTTRESIRRLWNFGIKLTGARLADVACNNSYLILIGRLFPVADVGLFTRGRQFASVPSISMSEVVRRVSYPILCRYADSPSLQQHYSRRMIALTMSVAMPVMLTLAALATPIVAVVLGEKWIGVAPLMTWLCLGMLWTPLDGINLTFILASGRVSGLFKIELIRKIIPLTLLLISFKFGLTAICIGFAISGVITMLITALYAHRPNRQYTTDGLQSNRRTWLKLIASSTTSALIAWFCSNLFSYPWIQLSVGLTAAILSFLILARLTNLKELSEISHRLRIFLRK